MKKEEEPKRRKFIKKLAYSAPVLTILGQLAKPTEVKADGSEVEAPPDCPPGFLC
jgi:hypothetical protein